MDGLGQPGGAVLVALSNEALEAAQRERVGVGCEGVVTALTLDDGRRVKVKRFHRRSELERSLVGAALLEACLREQGWGGLVSLPQIVAVDLERLIVVSAPFVDVPPPPWPARLVEARVRARTAVLCAAGLAAALPEVSVREITEASYGSVAASLTRFWFEGVALNETSLLTDGHRWFLVDF
jgi:hypothetical protein